MIFVWYAWRDVVDYEIPAEEVARADRARAAEPASNGSMKMRVPVKSYEYRRSHSGRSVDRISIHIGSDAATAEIGAAATISNGAGEGGPASARVITGYGFWIFLLSDIVMFSCFFAAFAVLRAATAGGPSGRELIRVLACRG